MHTYKTRANILTRAREMSTYRCVAVSTHTLTVKYGEQKRYEKLIGLYYIAT